MKHQDERSEAMEAAGAILILLNALAIGILGTYLIQLGI